jgi:hypothetical protein
MSWMMTMVSCKAKGGGINPLGYYVADSLHSTNFNRPGVQSISPTGWGKVFLVVKLEVPREMFIPSEEEYRKQLAELTKNRSDTIGNEKNEKFENPKRNQLLSVNSERFTLILADGRSFSCIQISQDDKTWASGWDSRIVSDGEFKGNEIVSVAVVMDAKDAKPPFKIKLDKLEPVSVPNEKIEI